MKDVLFICNGNVGRSQFAEAFYNEFVKKDGAISAGIAPPEGYVNPSEKNIQVMAEAGIDISKAKVKRLSEDIFKQAKHIISFVDKEQLPKYAQRFKNIEFWKVDDPHYFDIDGRRRIRDEVKEKILKHKKAL